jgi:hypothetical protein
VGRLVRVFDDEIWARTVDRVNSGLCTPFIGAGASVDYLPLAADLAEALAHGSHYPFGNPHDLARVSQFLAVEGGDRQYVKEKLVSNMFAKEKVQVPDFSAQDEPYGLLADLRLPIYLTTNYDDFMYNAIEDRGRKPRRAICPWYTTDSAEITRARRPFREKAGYALDRDRPIVYHLHGHHETPESLVLTEDDYIEFLVRVSRDRKLLPPVIQGLLGSQMLLFIGYKLEDWTFRVIFGGLLSARPPLAQRTHVSVQLPPDTEGSAEDSAHAQEYLDKYFDQQHISICWMTARKFSAELRQRWQAP